MNPSPGPWRWQLDISQPKNLMDSGYRCVLVAEPAAGPDDAALIALAPEMREALLKLEWAAYDGSAGVGFCPSCQAVEPLEQGGGKHAQGCTLAALLEKLR